MVANGAGCRWRRLAVPAVALYAIFLATTPFEHHDLLCHLKTPQHCTSCASSPLSVNPHTPAVLETTHLADAGRAIALDPSCESTLLPASSTGRSPPAFV
jgi:hypothetical protein